MIKVVKAIFLLMKRDTRDHLVLDENSLVIDISPVVTFWFANARS
jgi:hypothetical protein